MHYFCIFFAMAVFFQRWNKWLKLFLDCRITYNSPWWLFSLRTIDSNQASYFSSLYLTCHFDSIKSICFPCKIVSFISFLAKQMKSLLKGTGCGSSQRQSKLDMRFRELFILELSSEITESQHNWDTLPVSCTGRKLVRKCKCASMFIIDIGL